MLQQLLIGDFNGDGRDDILCHQMSNGYKWISLAESDGSFSHTSWYETLEYKNNKLGGLENNQINFATPQSGIDIHGTIRSSL